MSSPPPSRSEIRAALESALDGRREWIETFEHNEWDDPNYSKAAAIERRHEEVLTWLRDTLSPGDDANMRQHVWRIWKLAWMRRDCIPYGGKIEGWTRIGSRLFWCSGYSRVFEIRCAYRQGWTDGNGRPRVRDLDRIVELSDKGADYYVASVTGASR